MLLLHELLKDWPCTFTGHTFKVPIVGITEHSQRVKPGFLFVARKGQCEDGVAYIQEAVQLGAAAVVIDRPLSLHLSVPVVLVSDSRHFLSYASAKLAGNPSERLTVIAITGTNGKTTVSHFICQLFQEVGVKVAVIGTLGIFIDGVKIPTEVPQMTTLPAEYLHPVLAMCESEGVTHVVMEASSLGLSTERLAHCEIDVGLLLNIGEDHYDEHGSKEAYLQAKQRLMHMAKIVLVNGDDERCIEMAQVATSRVVYFGTRRQVHFQLTQEGHCHLFKTATHKEEIQLDRMEAFNQLNALAAISTLDVLSYKYEKIKGAVRRLTLPEGRMDEIKKAGVTVLVDYAHTPDALETVLASLVKKYTKEIYIVFGCGGNRDRNKRKKMGEVAAKYASTVIITSDNPRHEDPLQIIEDIMKGIPTVHPSIIEVNRKDAIQRAIALAEVGDVILIAGKGHEKTQQIGNDLHFFSDKEIATYYLSEK